MKNFKTVPVLILAAIMVFASACSSQGGKEGKETKEQQTTVSETAGTSAPVSEPVFLPEETEVKAAQTTAFQETTAAAETTQPQTPATTEEIVALFNKSANRIKTEAVRVTKNYEKRIVDEEKLDIPDAIESVAKSIMKSALKDDTDPIIYDTAEDIRENYLVPRQDYVSRLKAKDVEKAVCTDNGKEYEIYILLKTEKNPVVGEGVGAVCDIIEANEVAEGASFVEEFSTEYYNCEVRATIDKETGRVTHAVYSTPLVISLRVNLLGTHSGAAGLAFIKDYTITY
ncbi:MAG: hypothetical protein IJ264_04130 [Clostridia bacterium]|nr:hypothetical protein [Clostridia bacterium]